MIILNNLHYNLFHSVMCVQQPSVESVTIYNGDPLSNLSNLHIYRPRTKTVESKPSKTGLYAILTFQEVESIPFRSSS